MSIPNQHNDTAPKKEGFGPNMTTLLRIFQLCLIGLVIGVGVGRWYFMKKIPQHDITKDIQVLTEKIENVSKMVVVEGTFSEIYSYKDVYPIFYDYLKFEKKALLKVKAKAALSINLKELDYIVDEQNKAIILQRIPEPEMMIEPELTYFDLEESTFNEFSVEELNKINRESVDKIREQIRESNLFEQAKERTVESIKDVELLAKYLGWEFIDETGTRQLSIDGVRMVDWVQRFEFLYVKVLILINL